MDPLDLVDPLRLLLLLLPERYRAPVGALITLAVATQAVAASVVSRLPLSARQHPRWGRVVRALHWYSLLRMRDEAGTTKGVGAVPESQVVAVLVPPSVGPLAPPSESP